MYFPFHRDVGSQTSNSMCESLVGAITPWTRQNSGSFSKAVKDDESAAGFFSGNLNVPRTACAEVIVVFGIFSSATLSHVAAAAGPAKISRPSEIENANQDRRPIVRSLQTADHVQLRQK